MYFDRAFGSPTIRRPGAAGAPYSAQKCCEAALLPKDGAKITWELPSHAVVARNAVQNSSGQVRRLTLCLFSPYWEACLTSTTYHSSKPDG